MAPIINGKAILARPRGKFKLIPIEPESKISALHQKFAATGLPIKTYFACLPIIICINPVINTKMEIGNLRLFIVLKKTGKNNFLHISPAITSGIFVIKNIGRKSYQQSPVPRQNTAGFTEAGRKNDGSV